ncbi:hypothetical protein [Streptomyces sp. NPDC001652]|uniref:hypothetical protein n=1 Tax=Streptomyces sp. NPDC001652 TaxID=3154393 RepID=UPI003325B689
MPARERTEEHAMLPMDRLRARLRNTTTPVTWNAPRTSDRDTSPHCVARLPSTPEERFGPSCSSGLGQDSSFHAVIDVPACTFIPTGLLREPYEGPSVLAAAHDLRLETVLMTAGLAEAEDEELGTSDRHGRYLDHV